MINPRHWWLVGLVVVGLVAGCRTPDSRLTVQLDVETASEIDFPTCYYREAGNGEIFVVGNTIQGEGESLSAEWIELKIYWKPRPGKTASNDTMSNALIWYAVQVGDGLTVYRGTAFVSVRPKRNSDDLIVHLRRASFDPPITLGPAPHEARVKVTGTLIAQEDSQATGRLRRELNTLIAPAIPIGS